MRRDARLEACVRAYRQTFDVCTGATSLLVLTDMLWDMFAVNNAGILSAMHKIPFLTDPTESFIRAASLLVNNWLFTPGQFVTRTGDLAQELYYIKYGEVGPSFPPPSFPFPPSLGWPWRRLSWLRRRSHQPSSSRPVRSWPDHP